MAEAKHTNKRHKAACRKTQKVCRVFNATSYRPPSDNGAPPDSSPQLGEAQPSGGAVLSRINSHELL
jgi:hypothetical protein